VQREREMLEADRINANLADIPKWKGTAEQQSLLQEFNALVERERPNWERGLERQEAEQLIARQWSKGTPELAEMARVLRTDAGRKRNLSEAYVRALADNYDLLSRWAPSLYEARYIREAVERLLPTAVR
jgi:hypothetical protein